MRNALDLVALGLIALGFRLLSDKQFDRLYGLLIQADQEYTSLRGDGGSR